MFNPEHVERAVAEIRERFPEAIEVDETIRSGVRQLVVDKGHLIDLLGLAKEELGFNVLYDLTVADYLEQEPFFHLIYVLHAHEHLARMILKVRVERENPILPSATGLWPMADWFEREVYDLFGVEFEGHPNLKRILMPEEWIGHPLRRDYPLTEEPVQFIGHTPDKLPSEMIPKQFE